LTGGVNIAAVVVSPTSPAGVAEGIPTSTGVQAETTKGTTARSSTTPVPLQHSMGKGKGTAMQLGKAKASSQPSTAVNDWAAGVGRGRGRGSQGKGKGKGNNSAPGRGRGRQPEWDSSDDEREQRAAAAAAPAEQAHAHPPPRAAAPAPAAPKRAAAPAPAASKKKVKVAWRPVWNEGCEPHITLTPLHIGMSVQAKYYAKPKVAPNLCKTFANKWHPGVIKSMDPSATPPVVGIHYDDDAREEGVLYSSLKAMFAEATPGAPAAAPPAPASPAAASSGTSSFATTVEECMEIGE
jgi:hypothetical protein